MLTYFFFSQIYLIKTAGRFPSVYTQAVMSGQGVAGMTTCVISLISTLGTPCHGKDPSDSSIEQASFSYFLASTGELWAKRIKNELYR